MKKNLRISFAIDERMDYCISELSKSWGVPKSNVIYQILFKNPDIKRITKKYNKINGLE